MAREILKLFCSTFRFECTQITQTISTSMKLILSANINNLLRISDKFIVSIGKEFYDKFISVKDTVPSSK